MFSLKYASMKVIQTCAFHKMLCKYYIFFFLGVERGVLARLMVMPLSGIVVFYMLLCVEREINERLLMKIYFKTGCF